jgi:hypothetical protein
MVATLASLSPMEIKSLKFRTMLAKRNSKYISSGLTPQKIVETLLKSNGYSQLMIKTIFNNLSTANSKKYPITPSTKG